MACGYHRRAPASGNARAPAYVGIQQPMFSASVGHLYPERGGDDWDFGEMSMQDRITSRP
ncbi:hypothetical protein JB92DRAFT_2985617 [Gautieria morchelliformis]|nr:hypothetical protein JB92DRAFT_2985617 [Gautieria morchelliformis]